MNNFYDNDQIQELFKHKDDINAEFRQLLPLLNSYSFKSDLAQEYAIHGLARRMDTLLVCIENIFTSYLPHNSNILPSKEILDNITINLQAFVTNLAGCLDNIAWVLTYEKDFHRSKGFKRTKVHLFTGTELHSYCSDSFIQKLMEFEKWNDNQKDYRDTLSHRIPLYIPPYGVDPANQSEFDSIEAQKKHALNKFDLTSYKKLELEQNKLKYFIPIMLHSWNESENMVYFIPQCIADFRTILELTKLLINELSS